jgi:O-antigen ligase
MNTSSSGAAAGEKTVPRRPEAEKPSRAAQSVSSGVLWTVGILLLALPAISVPLSGNWLAAKTFAIQVVGIGLATCLLAIGNGRRAPLREVFPLLICVPIAAFLAWVGFSVLRSDLPDVSRLEGMRYLGGALIFGSILYGLSARRHLAQMASLLLAAGCIGLLFSFLSGADRMGRPTGGFQESQMLGSFLALLFPLAFVIAMREEDQWRRLLGQGAAVLLAGGLLVTQSRSSWIGILVALVLMGVLAHRFSRSRGDGFSPRLLIVPVLIAVLAGGLFFAISQSSGALSHRASSLVNLESDKSLQWRLGMWQKSLRMARDKPVFGWGVGTFPIHQSRYFHPAVPLREQREVFYSGSSLTENAHNSYVQILAELGVPGLLLYLSIFAGFFVTCGRALRALAPGFQQSVVIGSMGAVTAQMVSAVGSPAWEFAECSVYLWVIFAVGLLAARGDTRHRSSNRKRRSESDAVPEKNVGSL